MVSLLSRAYSTVSVVHQDEESLIHAHLLSERGNLLLDTDHVHGLCVADDWSDETLFGGNGDRDIDVVAVDNGVSAAWTLNGCVDSRKILHGENGSARKGRHESKLDASLLEDFILVQLPELHKSGHVDLVESGKRCSGVLRLLQALSDPQTHAVHLDL